MSDFFKLFLGRTAADQIIGGRIKEWQKFFCFFSVLAFSEFSDYIDSSPILNLESTRFEPYFGLISSGLFAAGILGGYFFSAIKSRFYENFWVIVFALTIELKVLTYILICLAVYLIGQFFLIDTKGLEFVCDIAFVAVQVAMVFRTCTLMKRVTVR